MIKHKRKINKLLLVNGIRCCKGKYRSSYYHLIGTDVVYGFYDGGRTRQRVDAGFIKRLKHQSDFLPSSYKGLKSIGYI